MLVVHAAAGAWSNIQPVLSRFEYSLATVRDNAFFRTSQEKEAA